MDNINNLIRSFILSLIFTFPAFAQSAKLEKADKNFSNFNYYKAIDNYSEIAKNGYMEVNKDHVNIRLGDSYRLINDTKNAEIWYQKAVESPNCDPITFYNYSQILRSNKKYPEATFWMNQYLKSNPADKDEINKLAGFNDYSGLLADSSHIEVKFMDINSKMSDYSPSYFKGKIIFVSSRDTISARRSVWTDEPYYSLYECSIDSNNNLINYQRLFGEVNTKFHEGSVSYDKNNNILYFTRNNYINGKKGLSKDKSNYLKIYQTSFKDGKWIDIKELPFNNDEYSCAHPAISPDGLKLYFISNMPGGFGGTDIYYCDKQDSGWSKPINIGKPFNTLGNELFPFCSEDGTLFFASTGHPGLGGMDIFKFENGQILNLGYPINSSFDDFGICTLNGGKGYFSSNRNGGLNNDDIYFFKISQAPVAIDDYFLIEIVNNNFEIDTLFIPVLKNDKDADSDINSIKTIYHSNDKSYSNVSNIGTIKYIPQTGFFGTDTLKYVVFDQTNLSDTASLVIRISGKNPPIAKMDSLIVEKNSHDNAVNVLVNDMDIDGNLIADSIEIITKPGNGSIEVVKGIIKYTPTKDFRGKDFLVYQITDTDGLKDEDKLLIDVKDAKLISKNIDLNLTIYFETSRWDILPKAALMLDSIITILKQNSTIEIELSGYADSRGPANANLLLSQKRTKSALSYINKKGIEIKRIVPHEYGETMPVNNCIDGVNCTSAEHGLNRRVTIKSLK